MANDYHQKFVSGIKPPHAKALKRFRNMPGHGLPWECKWRLIIFIFILSKKILKRATKTSTKLINQTACCCVLVFFFLNLGNAFILSRVRFWTNLAKAESSHSQSTCILPPYISSAAKHTHRSTRKWCEQLTSETHNVRFTKYSELLLKFVQKHKIERKELVELKDEEVNPFTNGVWLLHTGNPHGIF